MVSNPNQIHIELTVSAEPPPSLLTVIVDTNPHAWTLLAPTLSLSSAVASLLVFINAHLAINNANKVAIIASHSQRAEFLYPPTPSKQADTNGLSSANGTAKNGTANGADVEMVDSDANELTSDANHYRPFQQIQRTLLSSLQSLLSRTDPEDLTPTTSTAGALTLALTYINKQTVLSSTTPSNPTNTAAYDTTSLNSSVPTLTSRILMLSVSGDLAAQYIPIMNTIFACQRLNIPIDICKIAGDTVFLQQASDATKGTYIKLERPQGLLQYLMMGFMPDRTARGFLCMPTAVGVDFRAACFCHRRVVDTGWVCSVCLSSECFSFLSFALRESLDPASFAEFLFDLQRLSICHCADIS